MFRNVLDMDIKKFPHKTGQIEIINFLLKFYKKNQLLHILYIPETNDQQPMHR